MQSDIAQKLKLPIHPITKFVVSIGSGEQLLCSKGCDNIEINIKRGKIHIDIFVLKMEGQILC